MPVNLALTLLVLLTPGDEAMAPGLAAAARATLANDATLELRVIARAPDDATALALAREAQAGAVAVVAAEADGRHARVRLYREANGRWLERELEFAPGDASEEKGRALGFMLGSMLPETATGPDPASQPRAAAPGTPAPAAEAQPVASALPVPPGPTAPVADAKHGETTAPARSSAQPWTFAIDAAAQGALAIGGDGSALGGELGGRYRLGDHLALRVGGALRVGHIEALEATALALDLGPGLVWRSRDPLPSEPWAFGLRVDGFARLQSVWRAADGQAPGERHGRFVPGLGLQLEALYALSPGVALSADTGARALLGETAVLRRGEQVASFAPVELVLALGASARF